MSEFNGYTILIVDDESLIIDIIKEDFEERGAHVVAASNAASAFDFFCSQHFDAVVSDVRMPVMSGIELMEKITAYCDATNRAKPALFFCSAFGDHTPEVISKLGISAVFTKPFKLDSLTSQVLGTLKSRAPKAS